MSVIVRIAFGLLAAVSVFMMSEQPPRELDEHGVRRRLLLLLALAVLGLGMAVPWTRIASRGLTSPGRTFGFLSKVLGWFALAFLPLAVHELFWFAVPACLVLAVIALGAWRGWSWVAWPWYAAGGAMIAAPVISLLMKVTALAREVSEKGAEALEGGLRLGLLGDLLLAGAGVALIVDVRRWQRARSGARGA